MWWTRGGGHWQSYTIEPSQATVLEWHTLFFSFFLVSPTLFQLKEFGQVYGALKRAPPVDGDCQSQMLDICGFSQVLMFVPK